MSHTFFIKSRSQLLAVASPGREEIIDAIVLIGPCTVPQLATFLGRSRHSLYYHLKALRKCGLLLESKKDSQRKGNGVLYDVPGRPFVVQYELASVGERQAVIALGKSRFRSGTRGFIRACHSSLAVTKGPKRNLWASHWKGWLSDGELTKVNKLFLEILGVFRNEPTARVGRAPHELTFALAPVLSRFDKDKSRPGNRLDDRVPPLF
jgi:predicted transcriptional regulator